MAEYLIKDTTLENLADKIRVLSGSEESITPIEMANELDIFTEDLNNVTATENDIIAGKTAYVKGVKVTGTFEPDPINNSEIIKAVAQNKILIGDTVYINNEDGVDKAYVVPNGEFTSLLPNSKIGFAKSSAKIGEEVTVKTVGENELLTFEEVGF